MKKKTVVIFGEALVDVFPDGVVPGGAPFNVARHLSAFGVNAVMVTRMGNDEHGKTLREEFERFGLTLSGVQTDYRAATGHVNVVMTPDGHRFDIPADQSFDRIEPEPVIDQRAAHRSRSERRPQSEVREPAPPARRPTTRPPRPARP